MSGGAEGRATPMKDPDDCGARTASRLRVFAAWLSLGDRRTGTLVIGTLLANEVFQVPASAEGTATGGVEGRACSRFSRVTATATTTAHDDVPDVPETCCPDTESDSGLKSSHGLRRPCVLSPAAVVIVVVRAVAAIAATEEQMSNDPLNFL
jgi:hypothetical protein